jgi:hypothetical protein
MKEKVKVENKWRYRLFVLQILSLAVTILMILMKVIGLDITWLQAFLPIIITASLPILLLVVGTFGFLLFFGTIYLFKNKEQKKKMLTAFRDVKWKRS